MRKMVRDNVIAGLGCLSILAATPVLAGSPETDFLKDEIVAKVPQNWQVHVSMRDQTLVVFLMPPYQEAFNLWYEPEELREKMLALCPGPTDQIWTKLSRDQNIAIEPTVGGKSAEAMRLTCKRETPPRV